MTRCSGVRERSSLRSSLEMRGSWTHDLYSAEERVFGAFGALASAWYCLADAAMAAMGGAMMLDVRFSLSVHSAGKVAR